MNSLFFLIPFVIVASFGLVQDSLSQEPQYYFRGEDFELIKNPDGSFTQTVGLPSYIFDGTQYTEYIYSETVDFIQIETAHGSVQLDKTTCEFNYFKSGIINKPILDDDGNVIGYENNSPLLSDTIKAYQSTDGITWNAVSQVNNAACNASWNGSELLASKTHAVGNLSYKYILNNGKWKTQLEVTNTSGLNDRYFGFAQIIDLNRDTINYGGMQKNLDNFDGTTFDRNWLENNQGNVIDLLNGFYFDFDLAFDNLNGVTVQDTGIGTSRLIFDYSYNAQLLLDGQTLVYDPTFGELSGIGYRAIDNSGNAVTTCDNLSFGAISTTESLNSFLRESASTTTPTCIVTGYEFNISNLPDTAIITDVDFIYNIITATGARNCDFNAMSNQPSVYSSLADGQGLWNDVFNGTNYVNNDATCTTVANNKNQDLGASADTDLQNQLIDNWFGIGLSFDSITRDGSIHRIDLTSPRLSVTYNMPPDVVNVFNATTVQGTGVVMAWSAGDANGGASPTYQIQRWSGSAWTQLASQAGTTYTDSTPRKDQDHVPYRVLTTDSIGQNLGTFPMPNDLQGNLLSKYSFDWVTTDSGLLGNDGTVTGNTLYQNSTTDANFPRVGFNFDGASYVTLPNESDYDFEYTDDFSIVMWVKPVTGIANIDNFLTKSNDMDGVPTGAGFGTYYNLPSQLFVFQLVDSSNNLFFVQGTANSLPLNIWTHIAATYGGGANQDDLSLYVNGVLNAQGTSSTISNTILNNLALTIGAESDGGRATNSQIDNVMIFDTELTADQVADLYNSASTPFPAIPTDIPPNGVTDLTATATSLSSVDLDWTDTVVSLFATITGYQINFTTPFGDPLTIITSNTGSSTTSYEVTGIPVGGDYSFRVRPNTAFGNNASGNIANTTTFSPFTIGALDIESGSNANIFPVLFTQTEINSTTTDVTVRYPNTVSDFRCDLSYEFAQINQTYAGLTATAYDSNYDQSTFELVNATNEIITFYCWDNDDTDINGQHVVKQTSFPFVQNINSFRSGVFGTSGSFGALDFITLLVIIISMIGFNKESPVAGIMIAIMVLGGTSYFGIIQLETTLFGALAVIVMIAILVTRK